MPIYEYVCEECGETSEEAYSLKNIEKGKEVPCESCKGKRYRKCGNNGGFRLAGGGVGWADSGYTNHD